MIQRISSLLNLSTLAPLHSFNMGLRYLALLPTCIALACTSQLSITLVGHVGYQILHNSNLANIWGYTDELGNEYALVGVNGGGGDPGGLSVVDVTDPANPVEVAFVTGPASDWREIKTWGDYAFVSTEAAYGLLIVDLSPLPAVTTLPTTVFNGVGWTTAHSLFIDENGRLYLHGSNRGNGGVIMYDLTGDPMAPVEVGEYDQWYCHDSYARGDTLYAGHIYDGFFSIVDVSDPANPVLLGTQTTPSNFTHNTWLDDSGQYLFTTDEVGGAYVGAYDVSDPSDIQYVDKLQSDPGSGTIPHNTYWLNDYLVTSYYTYGVVIYDVQDPHNMVEVGHYDTSPSSGSGFNGAWGVYPFLPSGNLLISDIEGGLFILAPTYVPACYLEGTVTDLITSLPINGATVTILGPSIAEATGITGTYTTGYHTAGTYDVLFTAPTYAPFTATGVALANGVVTTQDAQLVPLTPFAFSGQVIDAMSSAGIPDAQVEFHSSDYDISIVADANGNFSVPAMYEDTYTVMAGKWGWRTACPPAMPIDDTTPALVITLDDGYADDFSLDLGWTVSGTATEGHWERDEPIGQSFSGFELQTDVDVAGDCGELCFLTGNGPDIGQNDVQNGGTVLVSPVFDATLYTDPELRWSYWYFNGALGGSVDDPLYFYLRTAGIDHQLLEVHPNANMAIWTDASFVISDIVPPASDMQFVVSCAKPVDIGNHILECAFDVFDIVEAMPDAIAEQTNTSISLWPNPSRAAFDLQVPAGNGAEVRIFDLQGRLAAGPNIMTGDRLHMELGLAAGSYLVVVSGRGGVPRTVRLVVE